MRLVSWYIIVRHAPISACGAPRLAFHSIRDIPPVRQFGDSNRKEGRLHVFYCLHDQYREYNERIKMLAIRLSVCPLICLIAYLS